MQLIQFDNIKKPLINLNTKIKSKVKTKATNTLQSNNEKTYQRL